LYGAFAAGYLICSLLFVRMWRTVRAPLIMMMALAFGLMSLAYLLLGVTHTDESDDTWIYMIRLLAFVVILAGIALTNLRRRNSNR
jgi:peptidoglycan/LPS O-acetylase OafA/YrhL